MIAALLAIVLQVTPTCVADGPDGFQAGMVLWCKTGLYEKIHVEVEMSAVRPNVVVAYHMDLNLNADGWMKFSNSYQKFFERNTGLIEYYSKMGIRTTMHFFFGGRMIQHCWGDASIKQTTCRSGPATELIS